VHELSISAVNVSPDDPASKSTRMSTRVAAQHVHAIITPAAILK